MIGWADGRKTPCTAERTELPKSGDKAADKPADKTGDKPADKPDGDKPAGDKPSGDKADKPNDKPARPSENNADDKPPKLEEEAKKPEKTPEGDKPAGDKPKDEKGDKEKGDKDKSDAAKEKEDDKPQRALSKVNFPLGDFGRATPFPEQPGAVLFRNATVWTSGPAGRLEGADVLVEKGKIKAVGRGLTVPDGAKLIDATGKHISPGIIDCH